MYLSSYRNKSDDYLYIHQKSLKPPSKTGVLVHNRNLCELVGNAKWILWSQKTGVLCGYLRLLMNKYFSSCFDGKKTS